jgi:hypothetical protein
MGGESSRVSLQEGFAANSYFLLNPAGKGDTGNGAIRCGHSLALVTT